MRWFPALLVSVACSRPPPVLEPELTVVFGGDVFLGRELNIALHDENGKDPLLSGVAPLLQAADIAVVNGEGVIASGGRWADKGSARPYMYRAHPAAVDLLETAGIDLVAVGNNHSGDYGPAAMGEMLARLRHAGMDYIGGGLNAADARTPAYVTVGEVVVAFVGADLTVPHQYAATKSQPGSFYLPGLSGKHHDKVVEALTRRLEEARVHAHVVIFTPHWGPNRSETPSRATRRLAKALIDAGYDAILGTSAHWIQGVELIDGKPVVYDAGNFLNDKALSGYAKDSLLYRLEISRQGVVRLQATPLDLGARQTVVADDARAESILERFIEYSTALGTEVTVADGVARIEARPGKEWSPVGGTAPPRGVPEVKPAPDYSVRKVLPESVTPVRVETKGGPTLLGFELLLTQLDRPKTSQVFRTCWTGDGLDSGYTIHLEARGLNSEGRVSSEKSSHIPGDWLYPSQDWPDDRILCDHFLFRINRLGPKGKVQFYVGLKRNGRRVSITKSESAKPVDGWLTPVGSGAFVESGPSPFEVMADDFSGPLRGP